MYSNLRSLGLALLLCFFLSNLSAQIYENITREDIVAELEKRDLELEEVEAELLLNGIDINTLEETGVSIDQKETIQRVIKEMTKKRQDELEKQRLEEEAEKEAEVEDEKADTEPLSDSISIFEEPLIEEEEEVMPEVLIYGQQLFRDNILKVLGKSEEINPPDTYVLGPGDKLIVSTWGKSFNESEHIINNEGYIKILNGRQRVYLKGRTLGDAREIVKKAMAKSYSFGEGEFDLLLNFSRTVRISIYGEVQSNAGSLALSAFNSAFNALAAVGGTNDIGSLRKIILQKNSGQTLTMDIYELLNNPSIQQKYYIEDNDIIVVPASENIVTLEGAVKRPMKYELIEGEGVKELLDFAGGFAENAFKKKIQVRRFVDDDQKIIDIDWRQYETGNRNFELLNGDYIYVEAIESEASNYVEVLGEVKKPGTFERTPNMRITDLVAKAGLTDLSSTEVIYLTRTNSDGTTAFEKIFLDEILADKSKSQNLVLQNRDKIEIWSQERFSDETEISVNGAVREEGKFPYDVGRNMKVRDAVIMAGGLRRDASNFAIVHSNDPLNPKIKKYKTIDNLYDIFENPNLEENIVLEPFDSLVIQSINDFSEESFVRIEGAINKPGRYQYGESMTIKDLFTLAGGFKIAASTNNIEVSRVVIQNNEPTKTVVANLEVDRNSFDVLSLGTGDGKYILEPFDNIAVRYNKDFDLQQRVFLKGEVEVPGPYAIWKKNLRILDVINRAGGLTEEAFPAGATLFRKEEEIGSIVIKLDEISRDPNSEFNFVVKNGDEIFIPKISEFVTIKGATRVREVVSSEAIDEGNAIRVPYHKNKTAIFYINEFAGGFDEFADKNNILVRHANGEIKKIEKKLFAKKYPKVLQGSTITVGYKSEDEKEKEKKSDVDWTKLLGDSVSQAMSILTLILLIQRLD